MQHDCHSHGDVTTLTWNVDRERQLRGQTGMTVFRNGGTTITTAAPMVSAISARMTRDARYILTRRSIHLDMHNVYQGRKEAA